MKVIWTRQGLALLTEVITYLSEYIGIEKATVFQKELAQFVNENLGQHPERNPPCPFPRLQAAGYRCLKFRKKYIVIYRETKNHIEIIGIVSSKRDPKIFEDLIP